MAGSRLESRRVPRHAALKSAGLSWRKCKKRLGKRNLETSRAFLQQLEGFISTCRQPGYRVGLRR